MLGILLALQAATPAAINEEGTITVTATRLVDLETAWRRCKARSCPPQQDVAVSVVYASALFDRGDYLAAKRVLSGAVSRNRKYGKDEPIAVATLYQAQARLAMHEGDQDIGYKATWAGANVLKDAFPPESPMRLSADLRLAEWQYRSGNFRSSKLRYEDIARRAASSGQSQIEAVARIRTAMALFDLGNRGEAMSRLENIGSSDAFNDQQVARSALAVLVRLRSQIGDKAGSDAAMKRLLARPGAEPLLVFDPPMPRPEPREAYDGLWRLDRGTKAGRMTGLRWVDIGYWIRADGTTEDIQLLRGSDRLEWAEPLRKWLAARRYAPTAKSPGEQQGSYRVDRFTLTANYERPIGSLIRRRMLDPRFERMEMKAEQPSAS
jgi:hypothetical protein